MKNQLLIGVSAFALVASACLPPQFAVPRAHAQTVENGTMLLAQTDEELLQQQKKKKKNKEGQGEESSSGQQSEQPAQAEDNQSRKKKSQQAEQPAQEQPAQAEDTQPRKKKNQQAEEPAQEQPAQAEDNQPRKKKNQQAEQPAQEQPAQAEDNQPRKKKNQQAEQPAQEQPAQSEDNQQHNKKKNQQAEQPADQAPAATTTTEQAPAATTEQAPATTTETTPAPDENGKGGDKRKQQARDQKQQQGDTATQQQGTTEQPTNQPENQPATGEAVTQPGAEQPDTTTTEQGEEGKGDKQRKKRREQAGDPAALPPAEQKKAVEEAQQPATVSPEAVKPKDIVADKPVEQIVKQAEKEPQAVVSDQITDQQRQELKQAERRRRENVRENRNELIGAAAVGIAIGAAIPLLGGVVAADEGDRIVVERGGQYYVRKDESALFRYDAEDVEYERLRGGRLRETVYRPNGSQIITVRDAGGYVLRREKITPDGRSYVLFDARDEEEYDRPYRPVVLPYYEVQLPPEQYIVSARRADRELFYDTFEAPPVYQTNERYSLRDVRENEQVRSLVRRVDLDTINFETGSAYVTESQVALLGDIAGGMLDVIEKDPSAVFLIEGHTDAVGSEISNITLSDRRAEAVARILSEAYNVPPENMVTQGYGESYLKVQTDGPERANRRVTLRNITPILQTGDANSAQGQQ